MEPLTNRFARFDERVSSLEHSLDEYRELASSLSPDSPTDKAVMDRIFSTTVGLQQLGKTASSIERDYAAYAQSIDERTLSEDELATKRRIETFLKSSQRVLPLFRESGQLLLTCAMQIDEVVKREHLGGDVFLPRTTVAMTKLSLVERVTIERGEEIGIGSEGSVYKAGILGRSIIAKASHLPSGRETLRAGAVHVLSLGPRTTLPKIEHMDRDSIYMERGEISLLQAVSSPEKRRETIRSLIPITRDLIGNLCELHENGLVHRDLLPVNAMIFPSTHPLQMKRTAIIDFDRSILSRNPADQANDLNGMNYIISTILTQEKNKNTGGGNTNDLSGINYVISPILTQEEEENTGGGNTAVDTVSEREQIELLGSGALEDELMLEGKSDAQEILINLGRDALSDDDRRLAGKNLTQQCLNKGIEEFTRINGKEALIALFMKKGRDRYDATHSPEEKTIHIQELGARSLALLQEIQRQTSYANIIHDPSARRILDLIPPSRLDELLIV
ncbi:MAG: hypothetical protein HY860_00915 [Chlamydiales bacterium]|nr:hypothetical protein [Chlamydiales bacterium]